MAACALILWLPWWIARQQAQRIRARPQLDSTNDPEPPPATPRGATLDLRSLLDRSDVLVVDVETTGFGRRAEVLAVAVIDTTGRVLLDTVSLPQGRIPSDASDVHGFTRARLRSMGARPWPAVYAEVAVLLRGAAMMIAWNVDFDRSLLEQTSERHGLILPAVPWRCAMNAEADTRGAGAPWIKLTEAAERLHVYRHPTHTTPWPTLAPRSASCEP